MAPNFSARPVRDRPALRTYVVLACPLIPPRDRTAGGRGPRAGPDVRPLGTVYAATLAGAEYLALHYWRVLVDDARGDGRDRRDVRTTAPAAARTERPLYVLRVRRASACRTGWLIQALAQDGVAVLLGGHRRDL